MAATNVASDAVDKTSDAVIASLIQTLSGRSRRDRQSSAHMLAQIAEHDADRLLPYVDELAEAIERPEAQTRWEILDVFAYLAPIDPAAAEKVAEGASEALYDEESAMLRYNAFRYFSKLAQTSPERARRIWPVLDEALQCFHGNPEFTGMLECSYELVDKGDIDASVCKAVAQRMSFDAQAGKSPLAAQASRIIDLCKARAGE